MSAIRWILRSLVFWAAGVFVLIWLWHFLTIAMAPLLNVTAVLFVATAPLWLLAWLLGLVGWFWPRKS
jgi:hypothetical protein